MPNRILKESVCYSAKIEQLSYFEEVLFYRLIVNCDDFGRLDARPEFLRSRCFAVKKRLSEKCISSALDKLEQLDLIRRYTVDGAVYLWLPGWEKHQNVKIQRTRFPAPLSGQKKTEKSGVLNPIQSVSESESESVSISESISESKESEKENEKEKSDRFPPSEAFEKFWNAYPVKIRKDRAREAFAEVKEDIFVILKAIAMQKLSVRWMAEGGKYIPYPANWLKNRGWEDQLPMGIPKGASGELGQAELEAIERVMRED